MKHTIAITTLTALLASQQGWAQANSATFNTPAYNGAGAGPAGPANVNPNQNRNLSTSFGVSLATNFGMLVSQAPAGAVGQPGTGTAITPQNQGTALNPQGTTTAITPQSLQPANTPQSQAPAITPQGLNPAIDQQGLNPALAPQGTGLIAPTNGIGTFTGTNALSPTGSTNSMILRTNNTPQGVGIGQQGTTGIGAQGTALGQQGTGTALAPATNGFIVNPDGTTTGLSSQGAAGVGTFSGTNFGAGGSQLGTNVNQKP